MNKNLSWLVIAAANQAVFRDVHRLSAERVVGGHRRSLGVICNLLAKVAPEGVITRPRPTCSCFWREAILLVDATKLQTRATRLCDFDKSMPSCPLLVIRPITRRTTISTGQSPNFAPCNPLLMGRIRSLLLLPSRLAMLLISTYLNVVCNTPLRVCHYKAVTVT
jgi:hypothetical protein